MKFNWISTKRYSCYAIYESPTTRRTSECCNEIALQYWTYFMPDVDLNISEFVLIWLLIMIDSTIVFPLSEH